MMKLVADEVYKPIHTVDYQAVCFREKKTTNPASMLLGVTTNYLYTIYYGQIRQNLAK